MSAAVTLTISLLPLNRSLDPPASSDAAGVSVAAGRVGATASCVAEGTLLFGTVERSVEWRDRIRLAAVATAAMPSPTLNPVEPSHFNSNDARPAPAATSANATPLMFAASPVGAAVTTRAVSNGPSSTTLKVMPC